MHSDAPLFNWITLDEAAERRNRSRHTIWRWARQLGMLIYYRVGNQILIDEHDVMTIQDPKIGNPNMVNGRGDRNSGDGLDEEQSRMKAKYLRMLGERYPNVYIEIEEQKLGNRVMGAWVDRTKRKLLGYFPLQEWPRDAGTTAIAEVRSAS